MKTLFSQAIRKRIPLQRIGAQYHYGLNRKFSTMPNIAKINLEQLDAKLDEIVGVSNNFKSGSNTEKYEKGYRYGQGIALRVVRPKTTGQVSEILKYCNEHNIGVVPQGGNTGLVGSSNPDSNGKQIVLSTELLNKDIYQLDLANNTVRVGAGFVLDFLNERLHDNNLFLPIDIGSSGTCNIGGIIATNAAGTRSGRYGNAKSRTLETTVVLANGEIIQVKSNLQNMDKNLLQDNSKLDFNNPFIGSQGWLGVITEATMQLEERPKQSDSVILVPSDIDSINIIREKFAKTFGNGFTAFEGMSDLSLQMVAKHIPNTKYLFADDNITPQNYALLIEVSSTDANEDLQGKLMDTIGELMEDGVVTTGLQGKSEIYWHNRHHISEAISKEGSVIATDIAVGNREKLGAFRLEMTQELQDKHPFLLIIPFGHEMIGAMHYNIVWPKNPEKAITPEKKQAIQELIYDKIVHKYQGTYSAEHGVGPHNQWAYDKYTPDAVKISANELKQRYDPNGILNPNINCGLSQAKAIERE
jgi:FAD/FMN-containing dehydrogenase